MDEPQTKIEQHDLVVLASIMNMVTDLSKTIANHLAQGDEDRYLQAQHNTKMKHAVEGIHQKLSGLNNAFVGGDLDGHRQYHENAIEILRSRKEFWAKKKNITVPLLA